MKQHKTNKFKMI